MSGGLDEHDARRDAIATGGKTGTNEFYLAFESFSISLRGQRERNRDETFHDKTNEIERTNTNGKTVREAYMTTD